MISQKGRSGAMMLASGTIRPMNRKDMNQTYTTVCADRQEFRAEVSGPDMGRLSGRLRSRGKSSPA